ncbi:11598_t:CDS:1 [Gigaspora margarita]|uniref:11598_t:CDS:1 n=1 Tax=Gigaspora margarita TaxID=4874 RepID=A0ABN7UNK2_GIGMA|nr:11598_t:CDS:1 [Gigaspora margarita]
MSSFQDVNNALEPFNMTLENSQTFPRMLRGVENRILEFEIENVTFHCELPVPNKFPFKSNGSKKLNDYTIFRTVLQQHLQSQSDKLKISRIQNVEISSLSGKIWKNSSKMFKDMFKKYAEEVNESRVRNSERKLNIVNIDPTCKKKKSKKENKIKERKSHGYSVIIEKMAQPNVATSIINGTNFTNNQIVSSNSGNNQIMSSNSSNNQIMSSNSSIINGTDFMSSNSGNNQIMGSNSSNNQILISNSGNINDVKQVSQMVNLNFPEHSTQTCIVSPDAYTQPPTSFGYDLFPNEMNAFLDGIPFDNFSHSDINGEKMNSSFQQIHSEHLSPIPLNDKYPYIPLFRQTMSPLLENSYYDIIDGIPVDNYNSQYNANIEYAKLLTNEMDTKCVNSIDLQQINSMSYIDVPSEITPISPIEYSQTHLLYSPSLIPELSLLGGGSNDFMNIEMDNFVFSHNPS